MKISYATVVRKNLPPSPFSRGKHTVKDKVSAPTSSTAPVDNTPTSTAPSTVDSPAVDTPTLRQLSRLRHVAKQQSTRKFIRLAKWQSTQSTRKAEAAEHRLIKNAIGLADMERLTLSYVNADAIQQAFKKEDLQRERALRRLAALVALFASFVSTLTNVSGQVSSGNEEVGDAKQAAHDDNHQDGSVVEDDNISNNGGQVDQLGNSDDGSGDDGDGESDSRQDSGNDGHQTTSAELAEVDNNQSLLDQFCALFSMCFFCCSGDYGYGAETFEDDEAYEVSPVI